MASGKKLLAEEVEQVFLDAKCKLLDEYKNARTKMKYQCSCGNISAIVFDSFKKGNRCKLCGYKKISEALTKAKGLGKDFVSEYFVTQGCLLIDEYEKSSMPMQYQCCCGHISKISWNNFRAGKRCKNCLKTKRSGANNYQWREDRAKLKEELNFKQRCYKILAHALESLKEKKTQRCKSYLGYTWIELSEHIKADSNWMNLRGTNWHIDHIFPIKAFIDYKIRDVKIINCLDNLRPIKGEDNCRKNAKYDKIEFEKWLFTKGINL